MPFKSRAILLRHWASRTILTRPMRPSRPPTILTSLTGLFRLTCASPMIAGRLSRASLMAQNFRNLRSYTAIHWSRALPKFTVTKSEYWAIMVCYFLNPPLKARISLNCARSGKSRSYSCKTLRALWLVLKRKLAASPKTAQRWCMRFPTHGCRNSLLWSAARSGRAITVCADGPIIRA